MAITFVNKSAFASGTNALTVGAVASVQADDLILLFVESANENIATPTGYTQVTGSPVSTGTAAAAGGVRLAVFYAWATGADTTTSVADSGNHTTAIKIAYRGVDKTTPFDATPTTGIKTPASTSTSFPGITTTTANAKIVHASALDLDAASTATTGAGTNANLTGITERHDQTISGGVGGGLVIIEGTKATAGATGNTTATVTSTIQVYLTMALRELVLAARTGNLAATETGADTAALSGDVVVQGTAVATEPAGDDAFAASGGLSSGIAGTLAATETGADTASASGDVFIGGTLSATEQGSDTAALTGDVFVAGALSASEVGADAATASGDVVVAGSLSVSEVGQDTAAASASLLVQGNAAANESGDDAFQASSASGVAGDMAAVESGEDGLAAFSPPAPSKEIDPIGGAFSIPTRQQMRDMAQKQRIALGILPKPIQRKAKAAAKKIAQVVASGGTENEVKAALKVIPEAQRVDAMSAVQMAFAYYLAIQKQTQAQQEIARIQENQRRIAEILAEIERLSIIQREEDDIAFLMMQVVLAE